MVVDTFERRGVVGAKSVQEVFGLFAILLERGVGG